MATAFTCGAATAIAADSTSMSEAATSGGMAGSAGIGCTLATGCANTGATRAPESIGVASETDGDRAELSVLHRDCDRGTALRAAAAAAKDPAAPAGVCADRGWWGCCWAFAPVPQPKPTCKLELKLARCLSGVVRLAPTMGVCDELPALPPRLFCSCQYCCSDIAGVGDGVPDEELEGRQPRLINARTLEPV